MSLFVSAPIDQFSGLAVGLKRAGEWNGYVFFRKGKNLLYEEQVRQERVSIPENIIAEQIYRIRYDIVENDPVSLEIDLKEILLEQIKNSMDVKSYWRLCNELRFVCGDMRAIYGLDEIETMTVDDCLYIEDAFEKLRNHILELMHAVNPEISETPAICQAIHYIRKNYAEPVNQKELAADLGVSPSYLSHLFAQKVGVTFSDYLLSVRLRHAKRLLVQGKKKINEVALETGFENAKYFCKVFKGKTEMTPREYQKKYHGERRS